MYYLQGSRLSLGFLLADCAKLYLISVFEDLKLDYAFSWNTAFLKTWLFNKKQLDIRDHWLGWTKPQLSFTVDVLKWPGPDLGERVRSEPW